MQMHNSIRAVSSEFIMQFSTYIGGIGAAGDLDWQFRANSARCALPSVVSAFFM